jgi:hypothetical protein
MDLVTPRFYNKGEPVLLFYFQGNLVFIQLKAKKIQSAGSKGFVALSPWSRLPEKLIVTHLVRKFLALMEPEESLPCSQEPTTGSHPKPNE